jgi:ABC-type transport system involved in multi-copper enzyme maturation permease subunit
MPSLLHYRSWQGAFHSSWWTIWPIARVALETLFRRHLFWVLYGFSLFMFLLFFFGDFLFAWFESRIGIGSPQTGLAGDLSRIVRFLRRIVPTNGTQDTFRYFFEFQSAIVVVTLALAGALLVGNDFTQKRLVFYLSKSIHRWHYILGKCLAVAIVVQMMTTLPALGLYAQHAFDDWNYFWNVNHFIDTDTGKGPAGIVLLLAVIGYGTMLSVFLSILLVATASWMQRTMPLIMVWLSVFFYLRILSRMLVDGLRYDERFRLIDLWNDMTLLGQGMLGYAWESIEPKPHPQFWEAGLTLIGVSVVCLIYLNFRTRSVEIVR